MSERTIWASEDDWKSIKKMAEKQGRSLSRYLITLHYEYIKELPFKEAQTDLKPGNESLKHPIFKEGRSNWW